MKYAYQLFNSIRFNWFYILLSLLVPVIIYKMDTGAELVYMLQDNCTILNHTELILCWVFLGFSMWLLPAIGISIFRFFINLGKTAKTETVDLYDELNNIYNADKYPNNGYTASIPSSIIAVLPWIAMCATYYVVTISHITNVNNYFINDPYKLKVLKGLAVAFYFIEMRFLYIYFNVKNVKDKNIALTAFVLLFGLCSYLYFHNTSLFSKFVPDNFFLPLFFNSLLLFCFYAWLMHLDKWVKKQFNNHAIEGRKTRVQKLFRLNSRVYKLLLVLVFGILVSLTCCYVHNISPYVNTISILVLCMIFYILMMDVFFTAQIILCNAKLSNTPINKSRTQFYKLFVVVVNIAWISYFFFWNTNSYNYNTTKNAATIKDKDLKTYFNNWIKNDTVLYNINNEPTHLVFLVSGEGGGSRAAVYFLKSMLQIEKNNRGFYKHIFSISTISGSSVGLYNYTNFHSLPLEMQDYVLSRLDTNNLNIDTFITKQFEYNYFNANMLGLAFYDRFPVWLKNCFISNMNSTYYQTWNRNFIQEQEEENCFTIAKQDIENNVGKSLKKEGQPDTNKNYPLSIYNTTNTNYGKKGYFFSIKDSFNANWVNLSNSFPNFPIHSQEMASQSVPVLNNFNCLSNAKNDFLLGDGGMYENSGTSTTLNLYKRLKIYRDEYEKNAALNPNSVKIKFVVLNVINASPLTDTLHKEKIEDENNSILTLLFDWISKTPFNGHEKDAITEINDEVKLFNKNNDKKNNDTIYKIELQSDIAVTRAMCKNTINRILNYNDSVNINFKTILQSISSIMNSFIFNKQDTNSSKKIVENNSPTYTIYRQFRTKVQLDTLKKIKIENCKINIPPAEHIPNGNYGNEIRYFNIQDLAFCVKLDSLLTSSGGKPTFKLISLCNSKFAQTVPLHQIELWIND